MERVSRLPGRRDYSELAGAPRLRATRRRRQGNSICFLSEGVRGHLAALIRAVFIGESSGRDRNSSHYAFGHPGTLYAANMSRLFGEERSFPYYDHRKQPDYPAVFRGGLPRASWISPVHHGLSFGQQPRQGRRRQRARFVQVEPRDVAQRVPPRTSGSPPMPGSGRHSSRWGIAQLQVVERAGGYTSATMIGTPGVAALEPYSAAGRVAEPRRAFASRHRSRVWQRPFTGTRSRASQSAEALPLATTATASTHWSPSMPSIYLVGNLGSPGRRHGLQSTARSRVESARSPARAEPITKR